MAFEKMDQIKERRKGKRKSGSVKVLNWRLNLTLLPNQASPFKLRFDRSSLDNKKDTVMG
jgi:hypothetical protein